MSDFDWAARDRNLLNQDNVTTNMFSGGGVDGSGSGGRFGDFFSGGNSNNLTNQVAPGQLSNQNNNASWWNWGDTKNADGSTSRGIGGTAMGLADMGMNAYFGWKNLGIAEDQLALQKDAYGTNKANAERAYQDQADYRKRVSAALG